MRSNFFKMEFENRAQRPSIPNFGVDVARFQRFSVNKLVTVSHEIAIKARRKKERSGYSYGTGKPTSFCYPHGIPFVHADFTMAGFSVFICCCLCSQDRLVDAAGNSKDGYQQEKVQ